MHIKTLLVVVRPRLDGDLLAVIVPRKRRKTAVTTVVWLVKPAVYDQAGKVHMEPIVENPLTAVCSSSCIL